ncbi:MULTISPECIES: FkbM family methyltransferase [Thiorhodovibrio]|uniref:FkbM family methyltransferase n=1 Tax=Thiorhodovibrio TaxID=61593 RepID=UPI00191371D1|nr:FkbM family methyltransferase [Thiorhodovibrio litoralis]
MSKKKQHGRRSGPKAASAGKHTRGQPPAASAQAAAHQRLTALFERGEDAAARDAAQQLVARDEHDAFAWKVLGSAQVRLGAVRPGLEALRRAQALAPQDAAVLNSLGRAHTDLGEPGEAERCYRGAIALAPGYPEAHRNLGTLLHQQKKYEAALQAFDRAIGLRAHYVAAHIDRSVTLRVLGRFEHALQASEEALRIDPRAAGAHSNRGSLLFQQGRTREALRAYDAALAIDPNLAEAHYNRGNALHRAGHLRAAEAAFRRTLALSPDMAIAHNNLGNTLQVMGRSAEAAAQYEQARRLDPGIYSSDSNRLFCLNYREGLERQAVFEAHCTYAQPGTVAPWGEAHDRDPQRRLRVGLVSADFAVHSVAFFFSAWLVHHAREAMELFAYANGERSDTMTHWCRAQVDHWVACAAWDDQALARRIREDGIDVLVDLSGHSGSNRMGVFARRAAPVQVTWIGYPNTTGLKAMDYRLVDAVTDPPDADAFHTERLIRLPDGFLCYRPPEAVRKLAVCAPPMAERSWVTFVSFNNLAKIGPGVLERWVRILQAVPASRLLLKSGLAADVRVWDAVIEQLTGAGIAAERIEGLPRTRLQAEHFPWYHQADIALDTFPYNGTTTTVEALWMGVPVISECGDRHAARVGASLLTRLELPELIAKDADDYVRIAVELAKDPERLRRYRATLRPRLEASALRDEVGFVRTLEGALRQMWRIHCAGEEPRVFEVPSQRDPDQPTPSEAAAQALAAGAVERLRPVPPAPTPQRSEPSDSQTPETHWTLTIADGVKVCVPPDVKRLTTFVLLEQEDWFEAELPFLRELVQPGMGVLDIGANHGVYALSLAKRLQGQGRVIACEPASAPAGMLERSIGENGFEDVLTLLRVGLSDHEGEATLHIGANSELSSLSGQGEATETVRLTTLDALLDSPDWPEGFRADLLKLDAEGEEIRILQGGQRFFAAQDPLVLCDIRRGTAIDTDLIAALRALGLDLYRLVPGLNALVVVSQDEPLDAYQLNLFAASLARAAELAAAGHLLVAATADAPVPAPCQTWAEGLAPLPYVAALRPDGQTLNIWQRRERAGDPHWPAYDQALNAYLSANEVGQPLATRWAWLQQSRALLEQLHDTGDEHLASAMLRIRVLAACGARAAAVKVNAALAQGLDTTLKVSLDRPFLPPLAAYDQRQPQAGLGAWLPAAVRESLEVRRAHSAYFHRDMRVLVAFAKNANRSLAMDRRRVLLLLASGQRVQLTASSPLSASSATVMHRNIHWWRCLAESGQPEVVRSASEGMRLCLGGRRPKPGWRIVNIAPGPGIDDVADIRDLSRYPDASCTEIYASHVLEHVPQQQFLPTLKGLRRLLRPDGRLMISVPDMDLLGRAVSDPKRPLKERFHLMRMLFGGQVDQHDYHYIGLNFDILASLLGQAGFARIERVETFGLFQDTSDYAPYGEPISLNVVAYPEEGKKPVFVNPVRPFAVPKHWAPTARRVVWVTGRPRVGSMWAYNLTRKLLQASGVEVLPQVNVFELEEVLRAATEGLRDDDPNRYWLLKSHGCVNPNHAGFYAIVGRRDPRDSLVSWMRFMNESFEKSLAAIVLQSRIERHYERFPRERCLFYPYPWLDQQPQAIARSIARFLGLDEHALDIADMVAALDRSRVAERIATLEARHEGGDGSTAVVNTGAKQRLYDVETGFQTEHLSDYRDGDWQRLLTAEQIARMEDALAESIRDWSAYWQEAQASLDGAISGAPVAIARPARRCRWVASYPKSGNTWVRFWLAHLLHGSIQGSETIETLIPGVHRGISIRLPDQPVAYLKTHWACEPRMPGIDMTQAAIYVVRNPFDVLVSSLHYMRKVERAGQQELVREFIAHEGLNDWRRFGSYRSNVESWLAARDGFPTLLMRYEDMVEQPAVQAQRVATFFNLNVSAQTVAEAVAASSFERLKALEEMELQSQRDGLFARHQDHLQDSGFRFMREGRVGGCFDALSEEELRALENRFADLLDVLGYRLDVGEQRILIEPRALFTDQSGATRPDGDVRGAGPV